MPPRRRYWGRVATPALILSLGYLPRSLLIAAVNVFPFLMLVRDPYGFLQAAFLCRQVSR